MQEYETPLMLTSRQRTLFLLVWLGSVIAQFGSTAYCYPGISVFSLGFLFTPGEGDVSAGAFPP